MQKAMKIVTVALVLGAGAALAHTGVQNKAVKARMAGMGELGAGLKVLGNMAKGTLAFDMAQARAAAAAIAAEAAEIPVLFKAQEDDPKSEALPAIWANFADFTAKADALEAKATAAAGSIASIDDVRAALGAIGGECRSCHTAYRE